jgi:hypothetical protein
VCFDSQNTSLKELNLCDNQIGDVGASEIGAGLAYVSFCPLDERSFIFHSTRIFRFDIGAMFAFHFV